MTAVGQGQGEGPGQAAGGPGRADGSGQAAGGPGRADGSRQAAGGPGRAGDLCIGVVLEAFLDWPLERVLGWLAGAAPQITHLEVGAGGYAPHADGAQAVASLSGGGCGFISLGRYYPAGDAVWAEVFGTRGSERCDVIDPAEGERAQLEALCRQAESFAEFAAGASCAGATAADAIAALTAAEQVTAEMGLS
ncbi:MAG TPA: hypothetical protein VMK84_35585 [Streptosporangiaceae bacterium]|nr:hypothetical protein [Streptosporangiaceae bacterium]